MKSAVEWYDTAVPLTPEQIKEFGSVLVVAPHQDDESLGCGGTIALLKMADITVTVLFTSDGSMSHPNSKKYPEEKLILLREQEAVNALKILGAKKEDIIFLRLKDSMLPTTDDVGFDSAVDVVSGILSKLSPCTIILPWRRDPHHDHRATWQILDRALSKFSKPVRVLEYFVWLWERAVNAELPGPAEGMMWKVAIGNVMDKKTAAINAHVSQTTNLISDDPDGFMLSGHMLGHFHNPYEYFFELNTYN